MHLGLSQEPFISSSNLHLCKLAHSKCIWRRLTSGLYFSLNFRLRLFSRNVHVDFKCTEPNFGLLHFNPQIVTQIYFHNISNCVSTVHFRRNLGLKIGLRPCTRKLWHQMVFMTCHVHVASDCANAHKTHAQILVCDIFLPNCRIKWFL